MRIDPSRPMRDWISAGVLVRLIIGSNLLGLLAIYLAHGFMVVDSCLDLGEVTEAETGLCADAEGREQPLRLTVPLLCMYFVSGLCVSLVSVLTVNKIR